MMEQVEHAFQLVIQSAVIALELSAAAVILLAATRALIGLVHARGQARLHIRHDFSRMLLLGLDFTIGSDVLRVAIAPSLHTVLVAGLAVLVRVVLTLIVERELKHDEREEEMHERRTRRAEA